MVAARIPRSLCAQPLFIGCSDSANVKPRTAGALSRESSALSGANWRVGLGGSGANTAVDLEEVIDPAQFPEHELKLWKIHLARSGAARATTLFRPCHLFRTSGHPLLFVVRAGICAGAPLAQGGVTVKLIPGSHENIFMEPHVKSLALGLTAALSESREHVPADNQFIPHTIMTLIQIHLRTCRGLVIATVGDGVAQRRLQRRPDRPGQCGSEPRPTRRPRVGVGLCRAGLGQGHFVVSVPGGAGRVSPKKPWPNCAGIWFEKSSPFRCATSKKLGTPRILAALDRRCFQRDAGVAGGADRLRQSWQSCWAARCIWDGFHGRCWRRS